MHVETGDAPFEHVRIEREAEREGDGAAQPSVGHDELLGERDLADASEVQQERQEVGHCAQAGSYNKPIRMSSVRVLYTLVPCAATATGRYFSSSDLFSTTLWLCSWSVDTVQKSNNAECHSAECHSAETPQSGQVKYLKYLNVSNVSRNI